MPFILMQDHGRGWYCDEHESFENEEDHCECFLIAEALHDDRMTDLWEERTRR
jgi:hypothetical protein